MNERVARILNGLICTCVDGSGGYALAAGGVSDTELRARLWGFAEERATFVTNLQREVDLLHVHPAGEGTALAVAHRAFMRIHHALSNRDDAGLVDACMLGDEHAIGCYRRALESDCWSGRGGAHATVAEQLARVIAARDQLAEWMRARDSQAT